MYQVIRASTDYGVAVVAYSEIENPKPWGEGIKYFCYNENVESKAFGEITSQSALGYFGGIADGLGWGELPQNHFTSLEDVEKWRSEKRDAFYSEYLHKIPRHEQGELLDMMMEAGPLSEEEFKEHLVKCNLMDRLPEFQERYKDKFRK